METTLTRRSFINRAGAASLAIGAGALLDACGSGTAGGAGGTTSGSLTVWDFAATVPTAVTYANSLKRSFAQQYPKVKLNYQPQAFADYFPIVTAADAARSGPDVMISLAGTGGILANAFKNVAVPLQTELGSGTLASIADRDDFSDDAGNLLAGPQSRLGFCIYYNKKLFKRAGLDPEAPPKTYDQLVTAAKALKRAGITPFAGGNKEGYVGLFFLSVLTAGVLTRNDVVALDKGQLPYTDPRQVQALSLLADLVRAGYYDPGFPSATLADGVAQFATGKGAIFGGGEICDSASWRDFNPALGADNVGVIAGIGIDQPRPHYYCVGGGKGWVVTKYAKNRAAAIAWVRLALGSAQQARLLPAGTYPANTQTSFASAAPQPRELRDTYANATTWLNNRVTLPQVTTSMQNEIAAVLAGDKSAPAAMQAVQQARKSGTA